MLLQSLLELQELFLKELIISVNGSWHGSTSELLYSSDKKLSIALSAGLDKA